MTKTKKNTRKMSDSPYINDMDSNLALEILQRENPNKHFKLHDKGYVVRRRESNEKVWDRVCLHNKKPFVCAKCKIFYQNDDSIVHKGCVAPPIYGPKTRAEADPFYNRAIKVAPVISANLLLQERVELWTKIVPLGVVVSEDCIIFDESNTNSWNRHVEFRSRFYQLYQLAWILLHNRLIPKGFVIRHKCKTKNCYNPTHLEIGTQRENMFEDKMRDQTLPHGETHFNAKSKNDQILEIFHSKGSGTRSERAKKFGVSASKVKKIDTGESWSHVTGVHKASIQRREHQQVRRQSLPRSSATEADYLNLIENINQRSILKENGCIETTYVKDSGGYSVVGMLGHQTKAHIVVWEFYHNNCKAAPEKMIVRHKCDNPGCCNKDHLEIGTYSDNIKDQYARGRRAVVRTYRNQIEPHSIESAAEESRDTELHTISELKVSKPDEKIMEMKAAELSDAKDLEAISVRNQHLVDQNAVFVACFNAKYEIDKQIDSNYKRRYHDLYYFSRKRRRT